MGNILITGANGFIGTSLMKIMKKNKKNVVSLVNTFDENLEGIVEVADLRDKKRIFEIFEKHRPNVVIHLAAIASVTHDNISEIYDVNVCGTENLLEAAQTFCEQGTRVLLTSTAGVYGNQDEKYLKEDIPFNPANHYSCSKMVTECISRQYSRDLDISIIRPFNVIGVGQVDTFFVPKLARTFAKKEKVISLGNISAIRDYIDVDFCANIFYLLIEERGKYPIINICSGVPHSGESIISMLIEITGHSPEIKINDTFVRKNEVWQLVGDDTFLKQLTANKFSPMPIKDILTDILESYKKN